MIEMTALGNHTDVNLCMRDFDKCTLMTAITAILVGQSIDRNRIDEVATPFLVIKGWFCSLYVATLDKQGIPPIKKIKFPGAQSNSNIPSDKCSIAESPTRSRTELVVALAILLHKFKQLFDGQAQEKVQ